MNRMALKISLSLLCLIGMAIPVEVDAQQHARGRKPPANLQALQIRSATMFAEHLKSLPPATEATWDSVALGLVGPIKDQSQCGSCWAFSGVAVVETAIAKSYGGAVPVLSEQYILDCLRTGGCNGDDNTTVLAAAKSTGVPLTLDYGPYTSGSGYTGSCKFKAGTTLYKIADWGFCDSIAGQGVADTQAIKDCIKSYGSVGCAIAADNAFESYQPGTVFRGSGSRSIDHDIELVGWDDSKGAWKLRNSWGTSWGNGGYMWISYGANLVGTEAVFAYVTPAPTPVPPTPPPPVPPAPPVPPVPPVPPTPIATTFSGPLSGHVGGQSLHGTATATVNGDTITLTIKGYAGARQVSGVSTMTAGTSVPVMQPCQAGTAVPQSRREQRRANRVHRRSRT